ncbi:MAG: hypothetical protein FWG84_06760 [Bacteroidales bacterium]|nr:hypothetical protein [Bacteroidales bacterium]
MTKFIKNTIPFMAFMLSISLHVSAQNLLIFDLQDDQSGEKNVVIRNSSDIAAPAFDLSIGITEDSGSKSIKLSIKRGADGDGLYLLYSLMEKAELIDNMKEFTSNAKKLWRDKKAKKEVKQFKYFVESKAVAPPYMGCYKQLPRNNSDDFVLPVITSKDTIDLVLHFYVGKEKKKGKKTTQLLYRVSPITVQVNMQKDPCIGTEGMVAEIQEQIEQLETLQTAAREAVKPANKKCEEQLGAIRQKIMTDYATEKSQWKKSNNCPAVKDALTTYGTLRSSILDEKCPTPPPPPPPTVQPPPTQPQKPVEPPKPKEPQAICELESINNSLLQLQKDIARKQVNKESLANEKKEFARLKTLGDKNVAAAACKQELVTAYQSYCSNIEKKLK